MNAHLAHYCRPCREVLADGQAVCPFCEHQATPIDEVTPYGPMCRYPLTCAGKGSCPRDPCCGD